MAHAAYVRVSSDGLSSRRTILPTDCRTPQSARHSMAWTGVLGVVEASHRQRRPTLVAVLAVEISKARRRTSHEESDARRAAVDAPVRRPFRRGRTDHAQLLSRAQCSRAHMLSPPRRAIPFTSFRSRLLLDSYPPRARRASSKTREISLPSRSRSSPRLQSSSSWSASASRRRSHRERSSSTRSGAQRRSLTMASTSRRRWEVRGCSRLEMFASEMCAGGIVDGLAKFDPQDGSWEHG